MQPVFLHAFLLIGACLSGVSLVNFVQPLLSFI